MTRMDQLETATGRMAAGLLEQLLRPLYPGLREENDMPTTTVQAQHSTAFTQQLEALHINDLVVFNREYNFSAPEKYHAHKGDYAVVADEHPSSPDVVLTTGARITTRREYIEKARGVWKSLADESVRRHIVDGRSVVRVDRTQVGFSETFTAGGLHVVKSHTPTTITLPNRGPGTSTFAMGAFSLFVPDAAPQHAEQRAMGTETALAYLKKFVELGQRATIRSRSWDHQGRFMAVELRGEGGAITNTLYTPRECDAELQALEARQPAIDVPDEATPGMGYHIFYTPQGVIIPSPSDDGRWTPAQVAASKGIVRQDGKKYRLCKRVTTLAPLVP